MRHKVAGKILGRSTKQRIGLRRNLMTQLFQHEQIKTTEAKAKAIKSQAEKIITIARNRGDANRLIELVTDGNEEELLTVVSDAQARRLMALANDSDNLEREAKAIAVHAQRMVARDITNREVVQKLFADIAPRYVSRPGGYTRITRLGQRKGDAAEMVLLSLVEGEE